MRNEHVHITVCSMDGEGAGELIDSSLIRTLGFTSIDCLQSTIFLFVFLSVVSLMSHVDVKKCWLRKGGGLKLFAPPPPPQNGKTFRVLPYSRKACSSDSHI